MRKYDFRKLFIRMMDDGLSCAKLSELSGVSPASTCSFANMWSVPQSLQNFW